MSNDKRESREQERVEKLRFSWLYAFISLLFRCEFSSFFSSFYLSLQDELKLKNNQISESFASLKFDETFKLMWNYYLSYCEGGFLSKNIDLKQIKLNIN